MAHDPTLATRVAAELEDQPELTTKRMFGSLAFLTRGRIACCVQAEGLLVRLPAEEAEAALAEPDTRPFVMGGQQGRGWVVVDPAGVADPADLSRWVARGVATAAALPPR